MQCTNAIRLEKPRKMIVPCGRCIACRIRKQSEWSLRIMHENACHKKSCFVTLTLDEKNLPWDNSVSKDVLRNFMKRLRKNVSPTLIRYFGCGDYGDEGDRPHYHIALFGVGTIDHKFRWRNRAESGPVVEAWDRGFVEISEMNFERAKYVAKYILRKKSGDYASEFREEPFRSCSKTLGLPYAIENEAKIKKLKSCTIGGVKVGIPRYYLKKIDVDLSQVIVDGRRKILDFYSERGFDVSTGFDGDNPIFFEEYSPEIKKALKQHDKNLKALLEIREQKRVEVRNDSKGLRNI